MIASSPSPTIYSHHSSPRNVFSRPTYPSAATAAERRRLSTSTRSTNMTMNEMRSSQSRSPHPASLPQTRPTQDSSTQWSSPEDMPPAPGRSRAGKRKAEAKDEEGNEPMNEAESPQKPRLTPKTYAQIPANAQAGGSTSTTAVTTQASSAKTSPTTRPSTSNDIEAEPSSKKPKPERSVKLLPQNYIECDIPDLVTIIASMMMELIKHNNTIHNDGLTRFHSRAPPGISVHDYLQRLARHATLSPPILLCMVYYIDRLCAVWQKFQINSLTVHRYLIASATVASKGLSDSFWTNATYARVGGISLKELALLELEFLWRIDWRIVPKPEILVDYYKSLVERCDGYEIISEDTTAMGAATNHARATNTEDTSER